MWNFLKQIFERKKKIVFIQNYIVKENTRPLQCTFYIENISICLFLIESQTVRFSFVLEFFVVFFRTEPAVSPDLETLFD